VIYFISNGNRIKIGITKNIKRRLKDLQTGNANNLRLIAEEYSDNDAKRELNLHLKFAKDRLVGEWFYPSKQLLKYINKISKYYVEYDSVKDKLFIYNKMSK